MVGSLKVRPKTEEDRKESEFRGVGDEIHHMFYHPTSNCLEIFGNEKTYALAALKSGGVLSSLLDASIRDLAPTLGKDESEETKEAESPKKKVETKEIKWQKVITKMQRKAIMAYRGNALVKYESGMLEIKKSCEIGEIGMRFGSLPIGEKWVYKKGKKHLFQMLVKDC